MISRTKDYEQAALVTQTFSKLGRLPAIATEVIQDMIGDLTNERVVSTLPKDMTALSKYENMSIEEIEFDLAWNTVERRSVDWILQNGKCLNGHFEVRKSSITKAGLGAFAIRNISKGELIAPVPLLHIADKESLYIFNRTIDYDTGDVIKHNEDSRAGSEKPIGAQLLLNYCFGHLESSVLLCPTTDVVAMNHCSNRTKWKEKCKTGANAGHRWPQNWSPETKEWLQLSLEELEEVSSHVACFQMFMALTIHSFGIIFTN